MSKAFTSPCLASFQEEGILERFVLPPLRVPDGAGRCWRPDYALSPACSRRESIPGLSQRSRGSTMRIAVFIEASPQLGGAFRQSLSVVESLMRSSAIRHDILVFTPLEETRQALLGNGIDAIRYKRWGYRLIDRWSATVVGCAVLSRARRFGLRRLGRHLDALLDDHQVDLALLNQDGEAALRIGDHPFIITLWDVDHRDHPDFPEWFGARRFERKERSLSTTLKRAAAVVANSSSGANRIASLYRVDPRRIIQFPFVPAAGVRRHAAGAVVTTVEDVRRKYDLPSDYVFYPAFFAFHKNHLYLLEGLKDLEQRQGIVLHAVFCGGGDPEDQPRVERQVQALGLSKRVQFLGEVPDGDVPALYEAALALVMPSYFGPTNLPPLEAVTLGCPVIYSDLPGCREQMGNAALYCDLTDATSLADQLATLVRDNSLRERLIGEGRRLAAEIARIDYGERLAPFLDEYAYIRRRWAWPEKATGVPYDVAGK